jgi:lysophospholipid hydrolase
MFVLVGVVSAASWVVRYRILNMYSRLPPEPQRKEPEIDLFPDSHEDAGKAGFASYLDEFLSAIKIFGYLERPVFHELTRSMQTRKLIAGETINLEEEKGFCIVVDGLVEIFVKSGRHDTSREFSPAHALDSSDDEEAAPDQQKYQLLTEVRNGAPMSSLFSIMSLFTEDVKLRLNDDSPSLQPTGNHDYRRHGSVGESGTQIFTHAPVSMPSTPHLDAGSGQQVARKVDNEEGSQLHPAGELHAPSSSIPPISLDPSSPAQPQRPKLPGRATSHSAHPDIIARATVDTTIAIIPASAFRRLIRIYPKATSHIVHVILSRFQRVTLAHAFDYLGLTGEVLQTEKSMTKYTVCQLPNLLRGDALSRLKEKFKHERARIAGDDERNGIALHNSAATRRRRSSSTTLRKEAMLSSMSKQRPVSFMGSRNPPATAESHQSFEHAARHPGDLANSHASRNAGRAPITPGPSIRDMTSPLAQRSFNPFDSQRHARISMDPRESLDEDNLFRASILECMFRSLGLDGSGSSSREPASVDGSPRLLSADQRRKGFGLNTNNAFGFMGPFEGSGDGETESITSGGLTVNTPPSAHSLSNELKDEVEIVFFPQGSVLVEQGERNPGLYYVIDGFLDMGTYTTEQSPQNILQTSGTASFNVDAKANAARRVDSKNTSRTRRSVSLVKPGGLAGYIGSVSSYRSFIDVVAKTDVYVGFLPRAALERIVDRYPIVLLTMAKRLTHVLPRLILHIDFALEWVQVNAGQVIFHRGDESEAIYIVLNGRLRLVEDRKDGGVSALAEFGQGESVGELEVLTETVRPGTLHAIRDTELVKFPRTLFNSLALEHPNITIKISKIIASRMRAAVEDPPKNVAKESGSGAINNQRKSTMNLRTVAILPVTAGVPVVEFGHRLMNALAQVGPPNGATSLNQSAILNHLGKHAFNKMGKLRLTQYLADLEEKYGLVVYIAGKEASASFFFTMSLL